MNVSKRVKKGISILLCLCMLVQNFPAVAFASAEDNLCAHHAGHTADCGYDEAAGQDCAYHCHICPVQELVNGLPEEVNGENAEAVAAQLTAIDQEKASLSDEELAQVDFAKYIAAAEALGSVYAAVPAADYTVAIAESENGSVTANAETVAEGAEVILTATPADGYELDTLQVTYAEGESVTEVAVTDNKFTMPAGNVTVTATFKAKETDPVCSCEVKCSEGSINSECAVCSAEGADLTVCTGAEDADPVCTCETKCSEDSINSECAVCSAEGADLTACGGECTHETYEKGVCTLCGAECTLDYDENGFCENGCFEPAEEADGVYQIGNAGNLFWFAQMINNRTEGPVDAVLTDDLDLEDREWIPIGTVRAPYSGMFDGSGHTISGLRLSQNTEFLQTGLFGSLSKAGIRNLTVSGSTAEDTNANYAGMLAAEMEDSILYNCYASGNLASTGGLAVGGLVGVAMHSVIINCGSSVAVNSTASDVGGLVGYMTAGYDEPMCLLNSYCTGTVSGTNAAGLVGYLADDALNNYYSGGVLFGEVGNSISVDGADQTFTPLIEKNYYIPGDTGAIGSAATGLDTTGYAESYSSAADLLNKLNGNLAQVEEIISGHRGYLETSDWAELVELLDGASVTASHWRLVDGAVVHCSGSGTLSQWVPNAEGTAHVATWSCCGDTVTEEHTFDEETLLCICGGATADAVAMVTEDGVPQKAYTALADAITAVKDCTAEDKAAVVLLQSQELTAEQVIASGVFTLDLKGCTITGSAKNVLNITGGTVTIDDSGENGAIQSAYTDVNGRALYINRATVEIVGGTIRSAKKSSNHGLNIYDGTVKISGGTVTGYGRGVMIPAAADSDTMLQITGGTVHGGVLVGRGRAEITGGTVNNGVEVDGGTAEISGGEIGGVEVMSGSARIIGGTISGVFAVDVYGGSAQISGGTITGESFGVSVKGGTAEIIGGTITGEYSGVEVYGGSAQISGGSISGGSQDIYYTGTGTVPLTLTLDEGKPQGATFPGGITVKGTTLSAILAEGLGYWQGERMIIPAADWFAITGGDVTVQAACDHTGGTVSYSLTETGHRHILTYSCCGGSITENHSTTAEGDRAATCAVPAYCTVCRLEYGKVDLTNHDEAVNYENGFCPNCDAYEPAELVNGVYEISNAGNLYWFADKVTNENAAYGSADVILTCDIRVNEGTMTESSTGARVWTPIGKLGWIDNNRVYHPYTGTFEGNGKTVSGLYFNDTSANFSVGLFSYVGEGGKVQNVGVADSYLCGTNTVGAVVGMNFGTVTGCYNTGTVSGSDTVGGVVGYNTGTVTNCYNTGTVSGESDVGGVVGSNIVSSGGVYYNPIVTDCYNSGTVSGSDTVGGVVGNSTGDSRHKGIVTGCYNTGTVSGTGYYVGGVAGLGNASNCYNTGTVSGESSVGGVVGSLMGEAILVGCYSSGTVSGEDKVGGVAGYNNATVTNCYFDSTVYAGDAIGTNEGTATNVEGKSTEQFKSGEVAYLLSQGENGSIWGQTIGTDPAPIFSDAKVYYGYTSCGDTAAKYTNDETIFAEKPGHSGEITYAPTDDGKKHVGTYSCCGTKFTENHGSMDSTTGKCGLCGALVAAASVTKNGAAAAYYETLNEAIAAVADCTAEDNAVVTLLKDSSDCISVSEGVFTLNLNGKTVHVEKNTSEAMYVSGGTVTVTGGTLSGTRTGVIVSGGTLNVTEGTVITTTINHSAAKSVDVRGGILNVTGGTITGQVKGVYVQENGTVNISGGIFRTEGKSKSGSVYLKAGTANISGGTFYDDDALRVDGGTAYVTGGTFCGENNDIRCSETGTVQLSLPAGGTTGATFPDGITVYNTTLTDMLGSGVAYWLDGKQVALTEGQTEITGGDVVIQAACTHENGEATYQNNEDGTHTAEWSCCGTAITEKHDFENQAHTCACGVVETFTVHWDGAASVGLQKGTSTYGQDFVQTITVPENTHLKILSVSLAEDPTVPVNYTYENGVLTIAAADHPAADIIIDCKHYVEVTFHANGGKIFPEDGHPQEGSFDILAEDNSYWMQAWNYGTEICLVNCAEVSREGYTFLDWRDAGGQVHQVVPGNGNYTLATGDITLYAQWQCNHTIGGVEFRDNGDGTHNGHCGECGELLGNYLERPHNYDETTHMCACGVVETFTVTVYDGNENIAVSLTNTTATFGQDFTAELRSDVEKQPHYEIRWYTVDGENYENATYENGSLTIPAANITGDIEIRVNPYVIVTLHGNGGICQQHEPAIREETMVFERRYAEEYRLFMEGAMIREGHEFVHFTTEANGSGTVYMQKTRYVFTEDLDLYAQWEANSYTLRLPDQSLDVTYGTTLADAVSGIIQEKTGYRHTGWTYYRLDDDDNEEPYTGTTMPAFELYAKPVFEPIEYNITWDMAGCSYEMRYPSQLPAKLPYNVDNNSIVHQFSFNTITPPAGYAFVGFVDGDGNELNVRHEINDMGGYIVLTFDVAGDMTVKAVTEPKSYMATWESTDGGGYEKEFKYGETITIPTSEFFVETFRKEGHTLIGWEGYTEGMTMPLDGITFTAIYQVNSYTITFDTDGGSPVQAITQNYGTAITAPEAPAKEGFHFVKWDTLPATMPGKNLTVKAIWEAHKDYTYAAKDNTITASCGICGAQIGSLMLTAPADCVYSGNPAQEAEVTGTIDGVTYTIRYTGTGHDSADAPINAGDYTVTLSAGGESVSDTFTISSKNLVNCSVTLAENSFPYSGKAPQLAVTVLDNGVGGAALTEGIDYSVGAVTGINAGAYKLTVTGTGNYTGSAELNYSITAKEVTVTDATIQEVIYDAAGYALKVSSVTFSGVVEAETLDYSASAALTGGNTAGDQQATVTVTLNNSNYTLKNRTFQTKVTIRKAASAVTAAPTAKDLTYVGYPQALINPGTATGGTLVYSLAENGDYSANIPTGKSAEIYTVWYYVAGDANHEDTRKESISVTIHKADAACTAPAAKTLTYSGGPQALVTAGTSADGKLMYKLGEDGTYAETIPTAENAGTYTVYWYVAGDSDHNDSAEKTVNVTIAKAVASVAKAPEAIADLVYNGSAQQLVTAGVPVGGVMMYNALNSFDRSFTEQLPTGTFAREYYVYYYVKGDDNHENSAKQLVKVTLAHAEIDSIDVTIAAPEAGAVPQGTIYYDGLYYARPSWSPSAEVFDFNTVYSASVQVLPKNTNGYMFSAEAFRDFKARMEADGWTVIGTQKSMTLEKTFPATRKADVSITAADQTILYGQTIAADAYSVVSEVDGLTVSAVLQASTTNVTAGGTITPSAAVITADGTDVTANYTVSYHSGKLVIAPDLSGIEGLTPENVTSDDTDAIKKVQEMLEDADSLKDEWTEVSDTCEDLLDVIEDTAAARKEVTEDAADFDEDTVKSTDKEDLQQLAGKIETLLDSENLTEDERSALEDVLDRVNDMIDTIEDTAADSKDATDTIDARDPSTVTSADKDELEQAIDAIEELLKDDHLTEDERAALEDAKDDAEELIRKIETAQDALDTENTEKVEHVTAENVKPEDKDALEDAREDLEEALQNYPDNYTEAEKESIQDEIQRIEDAIETLENVEDVTQEITELPGTVEPDDEETVEKILEAKENYDDLTDHEKSLVDETVRKKLENLVAALTDYEIIKGDNGKWMKGSSKGLSFTANGPYSKFTGIRVDGKAVDKAFYESRSGSTIITLKQSFLKRLSTGKHTITVVYSDGEASGTFRILAETSSPPTGDDSNILHYSIVMMTSFSALVVLALVSRKRKKTT